MKKKSSKNNSNKTGRRINSQLGRLACQTIFGTVRFSNAAKLAKLSAENMVTHVYLGVDVLLGASASHKFIDHSW